MTRKKETDILPMPDFSQLKICFVAGTLEHGGAERQLFYILRELRKLGAALKLLCFDRGQFWEQAIRSLGIPVIWVGERPSRFARLIRIVKELRRDPVEVLQSQHFFANAYIGLAARLLRLSGIGAMRSDGNLEMRLNGQVGGRLNLHLPAIIAANSRVALEQVSARGVPRSRLYFLPNVVDTEHFVPGVPKGGQPVVLLGSGRLVKLKRFDRLISMVGKLRNDLKLDVRALIVGPPQDPALRKELESQAGRLGLTPDHIQLVGGVGHMVPYYHRAAVFVLTSDFEGTPNVLLEAMASGLPVVSTRVAGVPEIVQDGRTGYLRNPDDLDGLVAAVTKLITNAQLRAEMGQQARDYIEQNHSLHRLPAYLAGLYQMALPSRFHHKTGLVESFSV
jgi:glycosyltransferase involved in cell wall biosynthesis